MNHWGLRAPVVYAFFISATHLVDSHCEIAMERVPLEDPGEHNSFFDYDLPHRIRSDLVFVFGSNEAGRHGKGAAADALRRFGAIYWQGVGFHGRSYAIPTKDRKLVPLHISRIEEYIKDFIEFTKTSGKKFYVTPVGTGLAGYKPEKIAPLFKGAVNCWFPREWEKYLK